MGYWAAVRQTYSPLLDLSVCPPPPADPENDTYARLALPVFLYNSDTIGEGGRFALNLFEPRYRNMCERISTAQLPPLMLFVPNFVDYTPRPVDFAKLCRVTCRPSEDGRFTMFGEELEPRTLELTWEEPGSAGLWFATSIAAQPQCKNIWQGTVHQAFRNALVRRKKWDYRSQAHIGTCLDLLTFRLPLPEDVDADAYYTETFAALAHQASISQQGASSFALSGRTRRAYGVQEAAFSVVGLNYPRGTARAFVRRDALARARMRHLVSCRDPNSVASELREAIARAAKQDIDDYETHTSSIEASEIPELPELPITVPLTKLMVELSDLFGQDGLMLVGDDPFSAGSKLVLGLRIARTLNSVRRFVEIRPDVFFRNDRQQKSTARCPTAGALPLDARIVAMSVDAPRSLPSEGLSFPYVGARLGCWSDAKVQESELFVSVSNQTSVNIECRADDVHVSLAQARRIARAVSVGLNWPRARLLFIGAAGGPEHLGKLPLAVIRHVASFLMVPF